MWGLWIPCAILILTPIIRWWALFFLLIYPLQVVRLWLRGTWSPRENWWRAVALMLSKFPEMVGQLKFKVNRFRRVQAQLIEYK